MPKQITTNGKVKGGTDAYHNQYLDTGSILLDGFMQRLGGKSLPEETDTGGDSDVDKHGISKAEKKFLQMDENHKIVEKSALHLEDLRNDLMSVYQECSSDERAARNVEKVIRKVEKIFGIYGIKCEPFDPLKLLSGLKSGDLLENSEKVVANTIKHYKLFGISAIKSFMNKKSPGIRMRFFGQYGQTGFEVDAAIVAKNDFNGNEAIDYVYSEEGGLVTVKARSAGSWMDVTEDYIVEFNTKRYKLGQSDENLHSIFLGEKIIAEGKEQILKVLNTNSENLTFGKCRVFSKDKKIIEDLAKLVKVN